MNRMEMISGLVFSVFAALGARPASAEVNTFGPIELRPGQSFELCVSAAHITESTTVVASFRPIKTPTVAIRSLERALEPGDGGCFKVDYEDVGENALFAILESEGQLFSSGDIVGSACVINGVFPDCPPPVAVVEVEVGGSVSEFATFGPVRIKPNSRLQVCASNALSLNSTEVTVNFYRAGNSGEPFETRSTVLEPGKSGCASVGYNRVGDAAIFAELVYTATSGNSAAVTLVRSAALLNGIFEHLPGKRRLTAVL